MLKYRIIIVETFEKDFSAVYRYIYDELKNPTAANRLASDVEKAIDSLVDMPKRHALVDDFFLSGKGIRCIRIKNYLLIYSVKEENKSVVIRRFLYARSDWQSLLKD